MSILKIAKLGHPVLRTLAKEVPIASITTPAIQKLISDMKETCLDADGAGLAAPAQVHQSNELYWSASMNLKVFHSLDQPIITHLSDELLVTFEGCLSVQKMGRCCCTNKSYSRTRIQRTRGKF